MVDMRMQLIEVQNRQHAAAVKAVCSGSFDDVEVCREIDAEIETLELLIRVSSPRLP